MDSDFKRIISRDLTERDYVLLFCLGFFILALIYGQMSEGMFNDDDMGYYLRAKAAIDKPQLSLSSRSPIITLLYTLPAQLGFFGMELLTALISAVTLFVTWNTAKLMNLAHKNLVLVFLSFQPLFFILSFSADREPLCALLIILGIFFYLREKFYLSAAMFSLLPLVRLELAVLSALWFIFLIYRKRDLRILMTFVLPTVLWQIIGWSYFGNVLWLYEKITATRMNMFYHFVGFWHWPTMLIFIIGPVVFTFLIINFVKDTRNKSYNILWATFLTTFLLYVFLSMVPLGGSVSWLRHLVTVSPVIALLSVQGYGICFGSKKDDADFKIVLFSFTFIIGITLFFLSYKMWGHLYLSADSEYSKLLIICLLLGFYLIRSFLSADNYSKFRLSNVMPIMISVLILYYTLNTEPPLKLSDEHTTVKRIAEWFNSSEFKDNPVYTNYSWFYYFIGQNPFDMDEYPLLTQETMRTSPVGSIMIWEPHYGLRLRGDVPYEALIDNDNFEGIGALYSPDSSFMTAVFIKKRDF